LSRLFPSAIDDPDPTGFRGILGIRMDCFESGVLLGPDSIGRGPRGRSRAEVFSPNKSEVVGLSGFNSMILLLVVSMV
jgi:hypothetical protein